MSVHNYDHFKPNASNIYKNLNNIFFLKHELN